MDSSERHRIDVWLKLVCLFKHRADATAACRGGHVRVNGQSVKPAATVRIGDRIELFAGDRYRKVVVQALPEGNVSKETARAMYLDQTPERPKKTEVPLTAHRDRGSGRPTKRERREIEKWRR
jgi:ribosome-associated heat shock protein Hsp15